MTRRKKNNRGGKRPGAGGKPRDPAAGKRVPVCVKLPRDVVLYLTTHGLTATIEAAVRGSDGFRDWVTARLPLSI